MAGEAPLLVQIPSEKQAYTYCTTVIDGVLYRYARDGPLDLKGGRRSPEAVVIEKGVPRIVSRGTERRRRTRQ